MAERAEVFESRYAQLNEAQQQAVDAIEGPLLVIAGPGSGKTELLSLRVANILRQTDVWPSNILCLTFTDAAAANMRQRLIGLIGSEAYRVAIFTFHSFSVEIINRHPEYFYHGASYLPASDLVQFDLLTSIIEQLPHDNPLRSHHPDQGFVYLREVRSLIAHIKRAGLSPVLFKEILTNNKAAAQQLNPELHELLSPRLAKQLLPELKTWAESLATPQSNEIYSPLALVIGQSLANAVNRDLEQGSTKFTSEWKRKYTRKDEAGNLILAESYYQPKLEALAEIYASYQEALHQHGYYDYDDMILDVIDVLSSNKNLRYEIGERYQYILVDEFQDTNDAQLRLLQLITDMPLGNDPNVMAVGDDDQAVFKFQGAQLRNITAFTSRYQQPRFISLAHNYRSRTEIIEAAQRVIADSSLNLQSIFPDLTKQYIGARGIGGELHHYQCHTIAEQYQQVVAFVKAQLAQGTAPSEIAIISRRHKDLEAIVPYMQSAGLPIQYEKQQSVFDVPLIHQLITICQYLVSLAEQKPADYLLPEILSYEFWQLPRELVWNLSLDCKREHKQWLELMLVHEDERIASIAAWLLDLGARARVEPATMIISRVIGGEAIVDTDTDVELTSTSVSTNPFKQYYFGEQNSVQYLEFLAALKTFIQAFSEHSSGRPVLLTELIAFVEMYHKNNLQLATTNQFQLATESITLVTAHKAKGQEFSCVALINASDDIWFKGGAVEKLRLPSNLPLVPLPDDEDDARRLLYVAMTRAKDTLAFFSSAVTETGKATPELRYLPELPKLKRHECAPSTDAVQLRQLLEFPWQQYHLVPVVAQESALLNSVLEQYRLSITHLQAFTNVIDNGPQLFFEYYLLSFPRPINVAAAYGSAIHAALHHALIELKTKKSLPGVDEIIDCFIGELSRQAITELDRGLYQERGIKALQIYYPHMQATFQPTDLSETDFRHEHVTVHDVPLVGKIDRLAQDQDICTVYDFKTGKAITDWSARDPFGAIKSWHYRQQLQFYALLIKNSRRYGNYCRAKTGIIEFVEPHEGQIITLPLEFDPLELDYLEKLIVAVYTKIKNLEFPDVSEYSKDVKGIKEFEEDLISGKI